MGSDSIDKNHSDRLGHIPTQIFKTYQYIAFYVDSIESDPIETQPSKPSVLKLLESNQWPFMLIQSSLTP